MTDAPSTHRLDQLHKLFVADPNDADLPYMIALEHAKQGDTAQAITYLDKTIALNPHYHYAYFQKAKLYDHDGEPDAARQTLDLGIALATKAGDAKALGELQELRTMMDA